MAGRNTKIVRECGVTMKAARYRAGDKAGHCVAPADSVARCGVCGWGAPARCGRHARQSLARHNAKKHAQSAFPFDGDRIQAVDIE